MRNHPTITCFKKVKLLKCIEKSLTFSVKNHTSKCLNLLRVVSDYYFKFVSSLLCNMIMSCFIAAKLLEYFYVHTNTAI